MTFNFYETKFGKEMFGEPVDVNKEWDVSEMEDKQYPKGSVVAVFDLDTIVYPISAFCDKTSIKVTKKGKAKTFKNRTEFKKLCKQKGWDHTTFAIEDIVKPEALENCLNSVEGSIERLSREVGATHVEYYVGGSGNFRLNLPLPQQYKSNRKDMRKPTHLSKAVEYVIKKYNAKKISGVECDDVVNIRAIAINKQDGVKGILMSSDKDIFACFSEEIYVYRQGELKHLNSVLGELHFKPNGDVIGSGLKWQITQALITGDPTDCYLPRYFFKKKYGEKTWYNDVVGINNTKEFLEFSICKFKELVGESVTYIDWKGVEQNKSWLELADMYWSCAYMKTCADDKRTFESLLKEFGVDYM